MNIFHKLRKDVIEAADNLLYNDSELLELVNIEIPKNTLNGDLSCNIAMIIASKHAINPKALALRFKEILSPLSYIASIEIAGPGFINFTMKPNIWHKSIESILFSNPKSFQTNIGKGKKVNIEYVSANPTGPMHVGHARGAVYGDVMARILSNTGYKVTKEYYVNDAGAQVEDLAKTVMLRYEQALSGSEDISIPKGLYPGEYLIPVGKKLAEKYADQLTKMDSKAAMEIIKDFSVKEMILIIKEDLKELGIEHDIFFSEKSLHDSTKITDAISLLSKMQLIYRGTLPPPKGKINKSWDCKEQRLFKSTNYGDDQDRPIEKADGSWSYFASDLAYAKDKIDRGYDHLIYVLGADHSGYIKRLESIVKAFGKGVVTVDVKICQLVNFIENGEALKMSKRAGNFISVSDVTDAVGKDIIRFMMLTRKNDMQLDFDLVKVREQSKDNPVFYVQYAYVRTISILTKASEIMPKSYAEFLENDYDLSLLSTDDEIDIIKTLASWSNVLEASAKCFEPHRLAFYLINLAAKFHALWNFGKENNDYRFLIENNEELTKGRLALAKAIQIVIESGFDMIGITPIKKM